MLDYLCYIDGQHCKPGEVDLHGLHVREAVVFVELSIEEAYQRGDSEIHFIVGKPIPTYIICCTMLRD